MARQRIARLGLLAAAVVVLGILNTTSLVAQTIAASPNTVPVGPGQSSGTTTLTWDGGAAHPYAEVWVKVDDNDETFVVEQGKGSRRVTIELGKTYLYILTDFGKTLATVTVTAQPQAGGAGGEANGGAGPFTGTWNTVVGGTHGYTVVLKQNGNTVSGSYSPGNGKIFDGVVVRNNLTFKWSRDGGNEGTGEFTLDENGKSFKGSSAALKPRQFTTTWNSFVPKPLSVAGVWHTRSMNTMDARQFDMLQQVGGAVSGVLLAGLENRVAKCTLTLHQEGDKVTGTYTRVSSGDLAAADTRGNGKIEGTLTGNILLFKRTSDGGNGSGRFVFDKSGMGFSGTYSDSDDPEKADGVWNGTRNPGGG